MTAVTLKTSVTTNANSANNNNTTTSSSCSKDTTNIDTSNKTCQQRSLPHSVTTLLTYARPVYNFVNKWIKPAVEYAFGDWFIVLVAAQEAGLKWYGRSFDSPIALFLALYLGNAIRAVLAILYFEAAIAAGAPRIEQDKERIDTTWEVTLHNITFIFGFFAITETLIFTTVCPALGGFLPDAGNYFMEYLMFIPKSYFAEIVLDFGFYWVHRACHMNKWLYKIHHHHHKHVHCGPRTLFYMSPIEFVADVQISLIVTFVVCQFVFGGFTEWEWHLLMAEKVFVEVAGHSGMKTETKLFTPIPWLQWYLDSFALITEDHEWHHVKPTKNFSKRLSLWDHVFGTYEPHRQRRIAKKDADREHHD